MIPSNHCTCSDIAQLQRDAIGCELRIFSDISKGTIDLGFNQDKTIVGYTICPIPTMLDLKQVL